MTADIRCTETPTLPPGITHPQHRTTGLRLFPLRRSCPVRSSCWQRFGSVRFRPAQANTPSLSATVNDDRSVTLTLSNGPSDWWFIVRQGSCTAATGTTAAGGRGYDPQFTPHPVKAYSDGECSTQIADTSFTIPASSLTAAVNNDKSVDLATTNPPTNWWFKINNGTCTQVTGTTVSGIGGYKAGTHNVRAFPNNWCGGQIAATTFTIP